MSRKGKRNKVKYHHDFSSTGKKQRLFADKMKSKRHCEMCTKCGAEIKTVKFIRPSGTGNKFRTSFVKVCECVSLEKLM